MPFFIARITSYNVCYTKLLRPAKSQHKEIFLTSLPLEKASLYAIFASKVRFEFFRITSYNVCYTKLLRVDVEGSASGIESELVKILAEHSKNAVTYAGGRNNFV